MDSPSDQKKDGASIPKIRTFQTDAQRYVKDKNLSPAQMAAKSYVNQQRQSAPIAPPKAPVSLTKKALIGGGVIGIVALLAGGWMLASSLLKPTPPPQAAGLPIPPSLVFSEAQVVLEIAKDDAPNLQRQISTEQGKIRAPGSLEYMPVTIVLSKATSIIASPASLVGLLGWRPPQSFIDQLVAPVNTFVYFGQKNRDLVFVLTTKDFERTLASLFSWEKNLPRDLRPYITDAPDEPIAHPVFQDEIVKNHSARVLKTVDDRVLVGYAIFNKKYVVLATSREALATVLGRFIALPPQ